MGILNKIKTEDIKNKNQALKEEIAALEVIKGKLSPTQENDEPVEGDYVPEAEYPQ